MSKAIQVVVQTIYRYVPDLEDLDYKTNNIETVEGALELDKRDYELGELHPGEMSARDPIVITEWSIVDE